MSAPEGTKGPENEEGGMLVAALAGVGILVAVGLLIFSGGDESATQGAGGEDAASASASAKGKGKASAFEARDVDDATRAARDGANNGAPKTRMNPAVAGMMVNQGMSSEAPDREPPKFDTPEDERDWWERQLADAQRLRDMRQRGVDKLPEIEKNIENAADPDEAREQFEARKKRLILALENSDERIAEIQAKLAELR